MDPSLEQLSDKLQKVKSGKKQLNILHQLKSVQDYLQKNIRLKSLLSEMPLEIQIAANELIAIGQMDRLIGKGPLEKKTTS